LSNENYYHTIDKASVAEYKDRGSKFIAYAYPVSSIVDFKEKMANLKQEHPKATHHCYAYRLGIDGALFRVSDDGEPSGTAGRPILGQIDSKQLTNIAVVVVRYFGGTLLGVPGLINAYKNVAAMSLQTTAIIQKPVLVSYQLQFDYSQMNEVMRIMKQFNCNISRNDVHLFCFMEIGIPKIYETETLNKLKDIRGVGVDPVL